MIQSSTSQHTWDCVTSSWLGMVVGFIPAEGALGKSATAVIRNLEFLGLSTILNQEFPVKLPLKVRNTVCVVFKYD